jgi:tRNA dimethylallyltransferase
LKRCSKEGKLGPISGQIEIVIVQGPTASGKSELAVRLAKEFSGEIINADSMQVYRNMDIGSAKPSPEMLDSVPHHLVGIMDPDQPFSAADFCREAQEAISDINRRGKKVFIVGGTGLYIKALTRGLINSPGGSEDIRNELSAIAAQYGNLELYRKLSSVDPVTAEKLHPNDLVRIVRALEVFEMTGRSISELRQEHQFGDDPGYRCLKLGIAVDRPELFRRIDNRVEWMMESGLVEEVERLLAKGYSPTLKPMLSLGYRQICDFLAGKYPLQEAVRLIKRDTRRYAKRQMTWFRKDDEIIWFEYSANIAIIFKCVNEFYCKGAGYGESTI